jgi:hypothetical protein
MLPRPFAESLLAGQHALETWLASLPHRSSDAGRGARLAEELGRCLQPPAATDGPLPAARTFRHTCRRSFEVAYWKDIARLAEGRYVNKSNADCVRDRVTQDHLTHHHRDLEALGDYLLKYYARLIARAGLPRSAPALVGELPFQWRTDFCFPWMGGWAHNQEGKAYERDLIVLIPGRDRGRAVLMADHYDTAYMVDRYDPQYGGVGARLAAAGADDNHSATAALMRAANELWNAGAAAWNRRPGRKGLGRGRRSPDGSRVPDLAAHLPLRGEVRLPANPHSTLYNTDGQIFSDAGIPVVLFMENYDINREGYHDTHDTMANIDLDYGAALVPTFQTGLA